ncbi:hypothetical protein [Xenorhabdus bovienii]|uniref:hypothetical protein n=1 Tax=Xenorhabdus bovienii TaxID=40576 RepID=UPI0023B23AAF|nr:hypothetical protein [Xenorhabdus bovienii]MDE9537352.1 hypothetical protein [Xenorhabdus bovienii]MDE9590560.1 hypothetical protein [Xenorhabdus bovienii]
MKVPVQRTSATDIDLDIAKAAFEEYRKQFGDDQSFERLHQRGGFCWAELAVFLFKRIQYLEKAIREIEKNTLPPQSK